MRRSATALFAALTLLAPIGAARAATPPTVKDAFGPVSEGVRLHYLDSGAASARTLVLIPGWRLPASLWTEQMRRFAPSMRVVAVDPRSQGPSTVTAEGPTPEARARDLHALLGALGAARPILVGWSQGAQDVAAYVQAFGSGAVEAVVLVDSPVSAGPEEITLNPTFAKTVLAGLSIYAAHPAEYSQGMVQSLFAQPHPDLDLAALAQATQRTPPAIGAAMLEADIFGTDRRPALAGLKKPALVIASGKSPLLEQQKTMAASIPGAKLVVIEDAAHAVFIDQPDRFEAALRNFLNSLSA